MIAWDGLIGLVAFLGLGFAIIPLDQALERRRARRRRFQARRIDR